MHTKLMEAEIKYLDVVSFDKFMVELPCQALQFHSNWNSFALVGMHHKWKQTNCVHQCFGMQPILHLLDLNIHQELCMAHA